MSRARPHAGDRCRTAGCAGRIQIRHGEVEGRLRALLACPECDRLYRLGGRPLLPVPSPT